MVDLTNEVYALMRTIWNEPNGNNDFIFFTPNKAQRDALMCSGYIAQWVDGENISCDGISAMVYEMLFNQETHIKDYEFVFGLNKADTEKYAEIFTQYGLNVWKDGWKIFAGKPYLLADAGAQELAKVVDAYINERRPKPNTAYQIISFMDIKDEMPPLIPELIDGVLRQGHKCMISAPSKRGKTTLGINLAISIASGMRWLQWRCHKGGVLVVNTEVEASSFEHRVKDIWEKLGNPVIERLDFLHLRGCEDTASDVIENLIKIADGNKYKAIIIDPIYKLLEGDENCAKDVGLFCRKLDKLAKETHASIIYMHHHSKGIQSGKSAMDRASGSGVYSRDADAIIDLVEIEPNDVNVELEPHQFAMRVDCTLREFANREPFEVVYNYPTFEMRSDLAGAGYKIGASKEQKRARGTKAHSEEREHEKKKILELLEDGIVVSWSEHPNGITYEYAMECLKKEGKCDISEKTLKNYVKSVPEQFAENTDGKRLLFRPIRPYVFSKVEIDDDLPF